MKQDNYIIKYIKRKNKLRKIVTYNNDITRQQHIQIKELLDKELKYSIFTKAYIKNSSIFENAKSHLYNDVFIKLDIKDFFNSINHKVLVNILYYELNLKKNNQYTKHGIEWLVSFCSINNKGIPLGLITSPSLANIYLKEFDNILYGKLKSFELNNTIYTRYADDLTISFKHQNEDLDDIKKNIIALIQNLLKRYKLKLNEKKIQLINFSNSNHVRITGVNITVDKDNRRTISVGRKKINSLYHRSIKLHKKILLQSLIYFEEDLLEAKSIKGMESFINSINKNGYDKIFSENMNNEIHNLGFTNLSELIKSFKTENDFI